LKYGGAAAAALARVVVDGDILAAQVLMLKNL
jgi:hypothetical protein